MENIKVSVILPVYKTEPYLRQCLDSIVNQTLKEIEIICVNDSSPDNSLSILEEYAARDSRIQILTQPNGGAGAARNNGMRHAHGKYLSILDSDDFFELTMLEEAYQKAEEVSADLVVFRCNQYFTETGEYKEIPWTLRIRHVPPYAPFSHRQLTMNVFRVFQGWVWDKLYLRSFVEEKGLLFQEQRTSNDMYFGFSATALAKKIAVIDKLFVHYRIDAADSLSKTREKSWQCFYNALCGIREKLKKEGIFPELEKDFINYSLRSCLWNLETLAEPTRTTLEKKLVQEWFGDLGIKGKDASFFQDSRDYAKYLEIIKAYPDYKNQTS